MILFAVGAGDVAMLIDQFRWYAAKAVLGQGPAASGSSTRALGKRAAETRM